MAASQQLDRPLQDAVRDGIARGAASVGLTAVALIHLLDLPGKFDETPYMAWMFLALIAGCLATAAALVLGSDSRAWVAAALLPLATIVGFALTRTTGLPQATDDIGNWTEPLGLASLFVEGTLAALAGAVLAARIADERLHVRGGYALARAQ
jgi:ABC-type uncharacterized transport system permease subunit